MDLFSDFWPWWLGAAALATISMGFPRLLGRPFGVSGVFARVLDPVTELRDQRLREGERPAATQPVRDSYIAHVIFIGSIAIGGFLGAAGSGRLGVSTYGGAFERLIGSGAPAVIALVLGGALVGFGTQMSGGCTSGHGLTGCSRAQPASLMSTATFFGMGIIVSVLLEWVMS